MGKAFVSFAATFIAAATGLGVACAGFTAVVDPLNFYRIPTWRSPLFQAGMQRYQNVGLARNLTYDSVVIGSSLMDNMRASILKRSWGVQAAKLSISGSSSREQRLILDQALATGKVERVFWSIEAFTLARAPEALFQVPFPWYMYRPAIFNAQYPLSLYFLKMAWWASRGHGEPDLDRLDTFDDRQEFSRSAALKAFHGTCENFKQKYQKGSRTTEVVLGNMRESIRQNVLPMLQTHPEVRFDLLIPPISTLSYRELGSGLDVYVPFREMLGDLLVFPNVRLHDFSSAVEITDNLDNYMDLLHFSRAITERVADEVRDGVRIVMDVRQLARNTEALIQHVNAYDLCPE
jgi:hypothetical protein